MPTVLYFTIPIAIVSFLIVVYFAIKDLNIKLNKDLLNSEEKEKPIGEHVKNILELQEQVRTLTTKVDEYKFDTFMLYKLLLRVKTEKLVSSKSLSYDVSVKKYNKIEINYDNSSVIKSNQLGTKLTYSNN